MGLMDYNHWYDISSPRNLLHFGIINDPHTSDKRVCVSGFYRYHPFTIEYPVTMNDCFDLGDEEAFHRAWKELEKALVSWCQTITEDAVQPIETIQAGIGKLTLKSIQEAVERLKVTKLPGYGFSIPVVFQKTTITHAWPSTTLDLPHSLNQEPPSTPPM